MGNKFTKSDAIHKHYDIKEKLGSGSFAVVKRIVRKSDHKDFAVKEIKKTKLNKDEFQIVQEEIAIMSKINNPNCVQLYEVYETKKKVYIIMELLTGGELFDRIVLKGSYSEKSAAEVISSVCSAIQYLHGEKIVHRDLKPENIIYANATKNSLIKITDFGLAKSFQKEGSKIVTACGTPGYVAPEVLKNIPYGPAVDMWSLGVILYILLCGFPPFYHENTLDLYKQIKSGQFDFPDPYWSEISSEAKNLVKGLLTVDPSRRLNPDQVMKHPWISNENTEDIGGGLQTRLKLLQAKSKFRRLVRKIIAINKFAETLSAAQTR